MKYKWFLLVIIVFVSGWFLLKEPAAVEHKNAKDCFIGGCSGQICSDEASVVLTCEFRQEYACYKNAKCERQTNGACGWTDTFSLRMCLDNSN